jgi:hypothetical protein
MSATGSAPFIGVYDGDMANPPTVSWGNTGGISTPVARNFKVMKVSLKKNGTIKRRGDSNGQMKGYHVRGRVDVLSVEMIVECAASGGIAAAAVAASLQPPLLSKITLAKLVSATDAVINGEWVYEEGAESALASEEEAKLSFDCFRFYNDAGTLITADTVLAVVS